MATKKGIDISYFQPNVDYAKVASQIDFVILREGYRLTTDASFFTHVKGFTEANVSIHGIYHFIYAYSKDGTIEEAKNCIANFEKAGLDKTKCFIWADLEYDTIIKAKAQGITYTDQMINENTLAFCEYVESQGYKIGIYLNNDYYNNHYYKETVSKYPLWLADYTGGPDRECLYQQYSESGIINGINGNVDLDYYFGEDEKSEFESDDNAVDVPSAEDILNIMRGWIGLSMRDGSHAPIINIYNSYRPLARGYVMRMDDDYCACTVSACFIKANAVDLVGGTEVGVERYIEDVFKPKGIWIEDDDIVPLPGDIICFYWNESRKEVDNKGFGSHIGFVEYVEGNIIHTIEGNSTNGTVLRRQYEIGAACIRGFARPAYGTGMSQIAPKSPQTASETSYGEFNRLLKKGHSGADVKALQTMLNKCGYDCGEIDGEFGRITDKQLKLYQSLHGLAVDGIFGPETKAVLEVSYNSARKEEFPKVMYSVREPNGLIRKGASKDYKIIKKIPLGTKVEVQDQKINKAGNLWYKIAVDGTTGWIVAKALQY